MGSVAYGVSGDTSDCDIYGFCIPPKEMIFPHLGGEIEGFGRNKKRFEQYQQHHIEDKEDGKQYDVEIFNIVKYFSLLTENNPNIVDSIFVPQNCVLHCTQVGNIVRENRREFLHKGCFPKFKGYAYSQLHKMSTKNPEVGSKREAVREKFGYDVKFAYHVVRLLNECEQILTLHDIDLQRDNEQLKTIRRGEVKESEIREWASGKEKTLEELYTKSTLPWGPDEGKIKELLLNCLEHHYGSLDKCVVRQDKACEALKKIQVILDEVNNAQN
jgi:predicted nucleotidyltransferase